MSSYFVDWFELTEPVINSDFSDFMHHQFAAWGIAPKHGRGLNGYRMRSEYAGAVTEQWSDGDERMGRHWTFTGTSWDKLKAITGHEPHWRYWVRKWAELGRGNLTRIDLANDWTDTDARHVANEVRWGMDNGIVRKRTWTEFQNDALGYTFYAGSRRSDVMLRCYDKGAEMDLEPFRLCRTEFEVKKQKARNCGDGLRNLMRLQEANETRIGDWLCSIMVGLFIDFIPVTTLDELGVSKWGVMPITLGSWLPKVSNEDNWWWNVVIPALVKRVVIDNDTIDTDFWEGFIHEFQKRLPGYTPEND